MNIICKIRKHRWKNGTCIRCGVEHSPHEWAPQPGLCEEKCVICGKIQKVKHNFSYRGGCEYVCSNCGETQTKHNFVARDGCVEVCSSCGFERVAHRWNPVNRKRRDGEIVTVPGCRCTLCGAPNPEGCHAFIVREAPGGGKYKVCAVCGYEGDFVADSAASKQD